jgi:NAD(P)-dependent dehydrogenase (short-subunit alcohol dehydrogenase family)
MNKIAVISGGLGDIGRAIALLFGQQGLRIAISDVYPLEAVSAQLEELQAAGCPELFYQQVDVSSEAQVAAWLNAIEHKWGVPQIVVPNAGIVVAGALSGDSITTEQVHKQMEVNFWGSYYLAVLAAKKLQAYQLPGRITFIGSWAAERPNARISAYCISKASVRMLCKTLALELAEQNILVNEIAPGIVSGGLSKKNQQKDPALLNTHLNSIPMHTLVQVEEIARHVLFLSDFSGINITGTTLLVDGGLSLTSKMTP